MRTSTFSIEIPWALVVAAKRPYFVDAVKSRTDWEKKYGHNKKPGTEPEDHTLNIEKVADADLAEMADIAGAQKQGTLEKNLRSILAARNNQFDKVISSFKPFLTVLSHYLQFEATDGWIYVTNTTDGRVYPELVTDVQLYEPRDNTAPSVRISTVFYGPAEARNNGHMGIRTGQHSFDPADVARRRVSDILGRAGIQKETKGLRETYDAEMKRHYETVRGGFAEQFVFEGKYVDGGDYRWRSNQTSVKRRVIHDLRHDDYRSVPAGRESEFFGGEDRPVPEHPVVRVFDLSEHELLWGNSAFLTPYVYDKTLGDKLVLPPSHRDLLNVMTTDLDAFTGDIVEGKSAGNIILGKGIPGVGKTLTAEIYSEIIEKPLYSVRSGALGTTASSIEGNLKELFQRQKRWGCILLLDEADVFVGERGDNMEKNAIVAEFLRVLEYFDGLLFMTTNRPNDIDEAIISRCAAVIDYKVPDEAGRTAVWNVLLTNYGVKEPPAGLVADLVKVFPSIAPRDVKMLLRLALRVAKFHKEPLTVDVFRRCAMFRSIEVDETVVAQSDSAAKTVEELV